MRLYLMRHGKAEKKSPTGRDEDRPLQHRGQRQSRWMGQTMAQADRSERPGLILTSPAVRAVQTANILVELLGCEVRRDPRLSLGMPAEDVLELIREFQPVAVSGGSAMVLVGHNPQLEIILPTLVPGLSHEQSEMRTGEAALLSVPESGAIEGRATLVRRMRSSD